MVTVGAQSTVVSGVKGVVTLNGNIYAAAEDYSFTTESKLEERKVAGTDIPIIITAEFHGEADMKIVYSTENTAALEQFFKLLAPTNGAITPVNFVFTGTDVSATVRTFTWTGTFWPQKAKMTIVGPGVVLCELHAIFNARTAVT